MYGAGTVNKKFIPVHFDNCTRGNIPDPLQGFSFFHTDTDEGYEDLFRLLTDQPKHRKPELGRLKALPEKSRKTDFSIPFKKLDIGYLDELVGRKEVLLWLEQRLLRGETNTVALASIHGAGIQLLSRMNIDTIRIDSETALKSALDSFYARSNGIVIFDDVRSHDIELLLPSTTSWRVFSSRPGIRRLREKYAASAT